MTYYKLLELKHSYYVIMTSLIWRQQHQSPSPMGFIDVPITSEEQLMLFIIKGIKDYDELATNDEFIFRLCDMLEGLINKECAIFCCTSYSLEQAKRIIDEVHKYKGVISSAI